jgi:hypothetical protein
MRQRRHLGIPIWQGRCSQPRHGSGQTVTRVFVTVSPSSHSAAQKGARGRVGGGRHHRPYK